MICFDTDGHLFEVTSDGTLVCDYINPVTKDYGILDVVPETLPMANSVFRAYRYGPDYSGLVGKTLTVKGSISGLSKTP